MTVTARVSHNLARAGKELHASPLPGTERFCLVTPANGPVRLGLTQVTVHMTPSGQNFGRVSFRFCDEESSPDNQYDESFDTAWFLVDHRLGTVQFGPAEGLRVRVRDQGVGCYILGQLIRVLGQTKMRGQYHVEDFQFTDEMESFLPGEELELNKARAETALKRAGFYVSPAGGKLVVGARKASDLKSSWNSERIRFLNIAQMATVAGAWISKGQANEGELEQLRQSLAAGEVEAGRRIEQAENREQELRVQLRELETELREIQASLEDAQLAHSQSEQQAEPGPVVAEQPPVTLAGTFPERITIEPSAGLMKLLWSALAVAVAAVAVAGAGHFV